MTDPSHGNSKRSTPCLVSSHHSFNASPITAGCANSATPCSSRWTAPSSGTSSPVDGAPAGATHKCRTPSGARHNHDDATIRGLSDTLCCWRSDLSVCWLGKIGVIGGRVCLVPVNTASRARVQLPHDRVTGHRGLALALMGAATSLCSGNGGGFAALEASPRRVAGVSRL